MARVGIDLDGVVYDFVESLREYLHVEHHWPAPEVLPVQRWEFYEDWGLTREGFLSYCRDAVARGYIFTRGEPSEGAVEALRAIREAGHQLIIVTDRGSMSRHAREATVSWLRKYGIEYDELHLTGKKSDIPLDYFVDDRLENYDELDAAGVKVFLWNQKWNEDDTRERRRVSSWDEYLFTLGVKDLDRCEHGAPKHTCKEGEEPHRVAKESPYFEIADNGSVYVYAKRSEEVRVTSKTGGQKGTKPARFGLIPPMALWKVAELYGKGAEKYDDWNWRKGYDWHLSYDAMQRHLALFWSGEDIDPETGMPHLACAAFHCLTLLTFMDEHPEFDDRFKGDVA